MGGGHGFVEDLAGGGGVEFLGDGLAVVHLVGVVAAAVEFGPEVGGGFFMSRATRECRLGNGS